MDETQYEMVNHVLYPFLPYQSNLKKKIAKSL